GRRAVVLGAGRRRRPWAGGVFRRRAPGWLAFDRPGPRWAAARARRRRGLRWLRGLAILRAIGARALGWRGDRLCDRSTEIHRPGGLRPVPGQVPRGVPASSGDATGRR